jgi:surfactin synthase thioesterase subunit
VFAGTRSNLPFEWFEAQAERIGCPLVPVDGGHFFMQEDTDRAVALLLRHLD